MAAKRGVTIVGAGNLASTLAPALQKSGYRIDAILSRGGSPSMRKARALAKAVGAQVSALSRARITSEIVWFCVPDRTIRAASSALADRVNWKGKTALHSSGALTSDELADLRQRGAAVASVHPLMTFVGRSRPSLAGVPFAVEGDAAGARLARRIVRDLRGEAFSIRKGDKAAYHAWGTFASPLLTALLATTERVAAAAGVPARAAQKRMLPILAQTLTNYAALGAAQGFSGPLIRGDVETVKRHLQVLGAVPAARAAYVALGKAACQFLPVKNRRALERALA
jgi:predicted short-subunit dehydrogenase-like oxidoreductase (DUF2520 family)